MIADPTLTEHRAWPVIRAASGRVRPPLEP
jgi:hypothetical protein